MLELERALATRLKELRVRIDVPDGDTVLLRSVPTHPRFFNKPRTNVLVKRSHAGMPFVVCVDEDLEYAGPDSALTRAFAGGIKRDGWRALFLEHGSQADLQPVMEKALAALGFDGGEPCLPSSGAKTSGASGLLASFGLNLSGQLARGEATPTVGREEEIEQVASCVLRWGQTRLAVIVGDSGVGKTDLLYGVARKLRELRPTLQVLSVNLSELLTGTLFESERAELLAALFKEALASSDTVLATEHLDLALAVPDGPRLLAGFLDAGLKLIGTSLPVYVPRFECPPLARRVQVTELLPPDFSETVAILSELHGRIAAHHRVEIDKACLHACVKAAEPLPGHFPAKALALLDAAAARASVSGAKLIGLDDLLAAAKSLAEGLIHEVN